jgi:hypothetical protein
MSLPCACYDNSIIGQIDWLLTLLSIGTYIPIVLTIFYIGISLASASFVGIVGRTPIQVANRTIFWIFFAFLLTIQFVAKYLRPLAETWNATGNCGACSKAHSLMWDQLNVYAVPDVYAVTVFIFGPLYVYYDYRSFKSMPWLHTVLLSIAYIYYNTAELLLNRQTVAQLAVNNAIILIGLLGMHFMLKFLQRTAPAYFSS